MLLRCCRFVVGPQRDNEAVTHVDAGLHPRLELAHRAIGLGQAASNLYFELGAGLMRGRPNPSQNVARAQAHRDAV
jgi:hypothetical protein